MKRRSGLPVAKPARGPLLDAREDAPIALRHASRDRSRRMLSWLQSTAIGAGVSSVFRHTGPSSCASRAPVQYDPIPKSPICQSQ